MVRRAIDDALHAIICLSMVGVLLLGTCDDVRSQVTEGPFEITGLYQYLVQGNTGYSNPNNKGLLHAGGKPYFNLMQQFGDLRVNGTFGEHWRLFLEPRLWNDLTKVVDYHYRQYQSLPADYRGDGWLLRAGGNDFKAELWNAYLDYQAPGLLIRVGRQTVAWGQDIALRVMDQINPLDLSQIFFFGRGFEEFDAIRIPEWLVRLDYVIPNETIPDLTIEAVASPGLWTPNILPQQGAPWNVLPGILDFREDVRMGRPIAGAQLSATIGRSQWTLNFLTRPDEAATGKSDGLVVDRHGGAPLLASLGIFTPFRVRVFGEHPRFYMIGGSFNRPLDWMGGYIRLENVVKTNSAFNNNASATKVITRPTVQTVLGIDRPTYIFPGMASTSISFQYLESDTAGDLHNVYTSGVRAPNAVHIFALGLAQPFRNKAGQLELVALADASEAFWLQPNIHYEWNDHLRTDVWFNFFAGAQKTRGGFAFFEFNNGPAVRMTYGF